MDDFDIPPLLVKVFSKGIEITLFLALFITAQNFVKMPPQKGEMVRITPMLICFVISWAACAYSQYLYGAVFGVCTLAAGMSGFNKKKDWSTAGRTFFNILPVMIFLLAALIFYFQRTSQPDDFLSN